MKSGCMFAVVYSQPSIQRNPSAIKQMLLDWCKTQCEGYQVC